MLPQHQARGLSLFFLHIWVVHSPLCMRSCLVSLLLSTEPHAPLPPLSCVCIPFHAFPRMVLDLSGSFCQKETRVSLGLQDSVVLRADNLLSPQPDHASIHGGG
jgi:hypothetical protein